MKATKDVVACVVDHGRFVHVARRLGQEYAKVFYTTPQERDCPILREAMVGSGFPEIERVKSLWEVRDQCDLFVFPDIGFEAEQDALRDHYPVWGCGDAGVLESNKGIFLELLSQTNLPVPEYRIVRGLTNLRLYLEDHEDCYLKMDDFRGDFETLHWTSMGEMESTLDNFAVRFGPLKETLEFYVFEPIEAEVEDGLDTYCVNGEWPRRVLHGMECKDKAYLGTMAEYAELPEEVRCVNEEMGPLLRRLTYGGAMKFSTEVRITEDKESYFIDPTCRFGSPPSQSECLLFKNLGEIIWRGSNGELAEPETEDEFSAQAMLSLTTEIGREEWRAIELPDELEPHVHCGFCCQQDGKLCLTPITEYRTKEVGYLVATGATMQAAIETLRDLKDHLPCVLKCEFSSLAELLKEIHEAEASGMPFTQEIVPEPETIVGDG